MRVAIDLQDQQSTGNSDQMRRNFSFSGTTSIGRFGSALIPPESTASMVVMPGSFAQPLGVDLSKSIVRR